MVWRYPTLTYKDTAFVGEKVGETFIIKNHLKQKKEFSYLGKSPAYDIYISKEQIKNETYISIIKILKAKALGDKFFIESLSGLSAHAIGNETSTFTSNICSLIFICHLW